VGDRLHGGEGERQVHILDGGQAAERDVLNGGHQNPISSLSAGVLFAALAEALASSRRMRVSAVM